MGSAVLQTRSLEPMQQNLKWHRSPMAIAKALADEKCKQNTGGVGGEGARGAGGGNILGAGGSEEYVPGFVDVQCSTPTRAKALSSSPSGRQHGAEGFT